jgi:hypothetical protein
MPDKRGCEHAAYCKEPICACESEQGGECLYKPVAEWELIIKDLRQQFDDLMNAALAGRKMRQARVEVVTAG